MDSLSQRSRPILKRPGRPLTLPSDEQPAQELSVPISVPIEELKPEDVASLDEPQKGQIEQQLEEAFSSLDAASTLKTLPKTTSRGQALEWSGFGKTMEAAVAKELWTDWRFDC